MFKVSAMLSCLSCSRGWIWKLFLIKITTLAFSLQPEHIKVEHNLTDVEQTETSNRNKALCRSSLFIAEIITDCNTRRDSLLMQLVYKSLFGQNGFVCILMWNPAQFLVHPRLFVGDVFPAILCPVKHGISHQAERKWVLRLVLFENFGCR